MIVGSRGDSGSAKCTPALCPDNLTRRAFRCLQIAARYLVIALAQIALGRVVQRWACAAADDTSASAAYRASILGALRPWSGMPVPRIRKDNGRALFQLCAALASSSATPPCEPRAQLPTRRSSST
jgi:hypothetical protein